MVSRKTRECAECKKTHTVAADIMPYWFHDYRKIFWLCMKCVGPVHKRYRERA